MKTETTNTKNFSRRSFIKMGGTLAGALMLHNMGIGASSSPVTEVDAHLWVYASKFPPDWDCTPVLDTVFSDLKSAGYAKIEIMESILKHEGSVQRLNELVNKYDLPVAGTSYYGDMWNKEQQQYILEDIESVLEKLHDVGGKMIGLTVGDAHHIKTEDELDVQADTLKKIFSTCSKYNIQPNLHNHTFEVENNMHDLKGTLARIPDAKLGPDLNWLIRGGVDPVWFIKTYGHKMVYMHIRDQNADGKWTEAVGEGVTDFPAIAKALKEINYKGKAAVELAFDNPPVRPVREDWKISRDYVKKVFGW
ncbi:MAG: sugar phosphate isomerase/epimerase family protein [Ilyomonas sp.]